MSEKSKTRKCKYAQCKHNGVINLSTDSYRAEKYGYYHEDCFVESRNLELFRNMWRSNFDLNVSYADFNRILNQLISSGFTSDYLLFVLDYVIKNRDKHKLKHPAGLKYVVNLDSIKKEYQKSQSKKISEQTNKILDNTQINGIEQDDSPTFKYSPTKTQGFGGVLGK